MVQLSDPEMIFRPIGRVSNGVHPVSVPLSISNCSTSLGVPGSNGAVAGSGDDVAPIGRISSGQNPARVALWRNTNYSTSLDIPNSNHIDSRLHHEVIYDHIAAGIDLQVQYAIVHLTWTPLYNSQDVFIQGQTS